MTAVTFKEVVRCEADFMTFSGASFESQIHISVCCVCARPHGQKLPSYGSISAREMKRGNGLHDHSKI